MPAEARRPNLFIIGAAKSGTTSLHHYLDAHPGICMSEPKEPGYFAHEMTYYPKDLDWYLGLFADAGHAPVIGESSTHYTKHPVYPGVPARIAAFAPDARFIYLMRDPVDRAISHYWHNVRQMAEHRPPLTALRRDVQYVAFSDYPMQLERYFEQFDRDRFCLLTFEEFIGDPARTVASILGWLGLDPDRGPACFEKRNSTPREFAGSRGRGFINRFRFTPFWDRLSPVVPSPLKKYAKRFALRRVRPHTEPTDDVVAYLRPIMARKVEELGELLGRDFPEWTTVRGSTRSPAVAADLEGGLHDAG